MNEILDIYDAKLHHIGTAAREEVHKKGYWHQTFHCWIIREENDEHYVLFQIRDRSKDVAPNKLDITAAGHLKAGETKEDGLRELREELGLDVTVKNLIYLGIRITASENEKQINKEFAQVYLMQNNTPIDEYVFEDGEVAGLVQMKISDGLRLCAGEIESVRCKAVKNDGNVMRVSDVNIEFKQLIPRIDSYYYKIFIMAERYFAGNRYLSI